MVKVCYFDNGLKYYQTIIITNEDAEAFSSLLRRIKIRIKKRDYDSFGKIREGILIFKDELDVLKQILQ